MGLMVMWLVGRKWVCFIENLGAGLDVSVRVANQSREWSPGQSGRCGPAFLFQKGNVAGDYYGHWKSEDALGVLSKSTRGCAGRDTAGLVKKYVRLV